VGQYPIDEIDQDLTLYVRRFVDEQAKIDLFEKRLDNIETEGIKLTSTIIDQHLNSFNTFLENHNAVGDYKSFAKRVVAVSEKAQRSKVRLKEIRKVAVENALVGLTECVTTLEQLIANGIENINWKKSGDAIDGSFDRWKTLRNGAKLPAKQVEELWKRFSNAREILLKTRRKYFDDQRTKSQSVKRKKDLIIEEARKLVETDNFEQGKKTFARMLDRWKEVGRGQKKTDDLQWEAFNEVRNQFYARIPKAPRVKKQDVQWDNDLSTMRAEIQGLDALAALKEQLKKK
jgi:hypothetical protein